MNVVTAQIPIPTAVQTQTSQAAAEDQKTFAVGALSAPGSGGDAYLQNVIRNTYIIIGLIGTLLLVFTVLTVVTLVKVMGLQSQSKQKYQSLVPPVGGYGSYYTQSGKYADY